MIVTITTIFHCPPINWNLCISLLLWCEGCLLWLFSQLIMSMASDVLLVPDLKQQQQQRRQIAESDNDTTDAGPTKPCNGKEDTENTAGSNIGEEIARNRLIAEIIFTYLDARTICRSKRVCREWKDLATKILSNRKDIRLLCYAYDFTTNLTHRDVKPPVQLLHSHELLGTNSGMMIEYLTEQLRDNLWSKPYFGLLFHGGVKTFPAQIQPVIKDYLPSDCQLIGIASSSGFIPGVVSRDDKSFRSTEIQGRGQLVAGMSYLLCPDMGFEVTPFDDNSSLEEFRPKEDGSHKKLKAVLIFTTQYMRRVGRREVYISFDRVNEMFNLYNRQIALGGVVVDNIHVFPGSARRLSSTRSSVPSFAKYFCGLALSGENIKTASGIFDMESPEPLEQEVKEFRASLDFDPDEQSSRCKTFGILFTCSGRGPAMFRGSLNEEVGILNRIFPTVIFNGIFGDGEFGENYWPKAKPYSKVTESEESKFWHFYTNVIVLIHVTLTSSTSSQASSS